MFRRRSPDLAPALDSDQLAAEHARKIEEASAAASALHSLVYWGRGTAPGYDAEMKGETARVAWWARESAVRSVRMALEVCLDAGGVWHVKTEETKQGTEVDPSMMRITGEYPLSTGLPTTGKAEYSNVMAFDDFRPDPDLPARESTSEPVSSVVAEALTARLYEIGAAATTHQVVRAA